MHIVKWFNIKYRQLATVVAEALKNVRHRHYNMSSQPQESQKPAAMEPPTAPPSRANPETNNTTSEAASATPTNTRLTALQTKKTTLEQTLSALKAERLHLATQAKLPSGLPIPTTDPTGEALSEDELLASALKSSSVVIKSHIALLHKYNEIKDIGQGLMGLIADKRDCRVVGVMEEFGVGEGD
jgi:CHAT domain-containing protein